VASNSSETRSPDRKGANFDRETAQGLVDAVDKALADRAGAGEGAA